MGTGADPVLFTSAAASKAPGDWTALTLASAAQASEIHFARIEYAGKSPNASLVVDVSTATIEGVTVASRGWVGIQLVSTNAALSNCSVESGPQIGVTISQGAPTIDSCTIAGSKTSAVFSVVAAPAPSPSHQLVDPHGIDAIHGRGPRVTGNTLLDSPDGPRRSSAPPRTAWFVANNTFQNAVAGVSSIAVLTGSITASAVWPKFVYVLEGGVTVTGSTTSWTLCAGTKLKVSCQREHHDPERHAARDGARASIRSGVHLGHAPTPVAGTWKSLSPHERCTAE